MLEIILGIAVVVLMYKIAGADEKSPWLWTAVTTALVIASIFLLPGWPFFRVGLALVVAFVAMIVTNVVLDR